MSVTKGASFTADTLRKRSANLWGDCPLAAYRNGFKGGVYDGDDFINQGPITAVTTDAELVGIPYRGFNSASQTHTYGAVTGGELVITCDTDNLGSYIRKSGWPFQISSHLNDLWFESRIKVNAITDNQIGFIMGLWDNVACSVVVPLSTANPPIMATTGNFVGFWSPEQDAGGVNTIYKADGQTTGAIQTLVHQFVADTYVKLGMKYSKNYKQTGVAKLAFYVNGVEQASTVTVPNNTGTTFPADVKLGFLFGQRLGATAASIVTCDWFECFQLDATPD